MGGQAMADVKLINPDTMPKPGQYSHIARVKAGELLFIAGQVATDLSGKVAGSDFDSQCKQVFANIEAALKSQGAGWGNVTQLTTYLVNADDIARLRAFRERAYPGMFPGGKYPPNTLLVIDRLAQPEFLIEVQTVAAL
jgi:enamine deaminase RidA (YjgF/YER057c/UK114 family)